MIENIFKEKKLTLKSSFEGKNFKRQNCKKRFYVEYLNPRKDKSILLVNKKGEISVNKQNLT